MHVCTSIVHVNGLGLILCVSVNLIMKFIYTPCKCRYIIFIYIHVSVKKIKINIYIYIYIILNGPIKLCKYVTISKYQKCDFDLRRGDFKMFSNISQLNGPLPKKRSKYTLTTNSYDFARRFGH